MAQNVKEKVLMEMDSTGVKALGVLTTSKLENMKILIDGVDILENLDIRKEVRIIERIPVKE